MKADGDPTTRLETVDLPDEGATAALAEDVAACLATGDVIALSGGLGAGKTTFARALIRAVSGRPDLEVPSPTFTLVQTYQTDRMTVSHFDLYRITAPPDLDEIGFGDAVSKGAVLVEWPERAGDRLPADRLDIAFAISGSARRATVTGGGNLAARFAASRSARSFLETAGWYGAARRHLHGDASTRTYERIRADARWAVLMNWPPGSQLPGDDPRARYRARDARAFVAVDHALRAAGLSAPEVYAADIASGFVLMEDLGDDGIAVAGAPSEERYAVAVEMLAALHSSPRPSELPLLDGSTHRLPGLTEDAVAPEIALFTDWYVPYATGGDLPPLASAQLLEIWAGLFDRLATAEKSWVLFDVQSPNLFWLPERHGIARIGVIDFQDMFVGPAAYDVASLCQDARITIPPALEVALRARYVTLRATADLAFDAESFAEAHAVSAALRAMKNLGVFASLAAHGKPLYLNHLPRLREYLARAFEHRVLSPLAVWYDRHINP